PPEEMEEKVRAAVAARVGPDFFILARTDAIDPEGLKAALRCGQKYLNAGADGIYVEGPESVEQLREIGKAFGGVPLATSILENGGKTPWLPPAQLGEMGFHDDSLSDDDPFPRHPRAAIGCAGPARGRPLAKNDAVDMKSFMHIVELEHWQGIE